jgi:hypothetical protein
MTPETGPNQRSYGEWAEPSLSIVMLGSSHHISGLRLLLGYPTTTTTTTTTAAAAPLRASSSSTETNYDSA